MITIKKYTTDDKNKAIAVNASEILGFIAQPILRVVSQKNKKLDFLFDRVGAERAPDSEEVEFWIYRCRALPAITLHILNDLKKEK